MADEFNNNGIVVTVDQYNVIVDRLSRFSPTVDEMRQYFYDCTQRGVHPLDGLIHFSKYSGRYSPIIGIDYARIRAESSGVYAGNDDAIFEEGDSSLPNSATIAVWKMVRGVRCSFSASARWDEYAPDLKDKKAFMWKKMPHVMLAKCAESLALRKAFPGQLHGLYTTEEMDQARSKGDVGAGSMGDRTGTGAQRQVLRQTKTPSPPPDEELPGGQKLPPPPEPSSPTEPSPSGEDQAAKEESTPENVAIVTFPKGKSFLANDMVLASWAGAFRTQYIGGPQDSIEKTGKWHSAHLSRHLGKHFSQAKVLDLTNREFDALLRYTMLKRGDKEHGKLLPPYTEDDMPDAVPAETVVNPDDSSGDKSPDTVYAAWHKLFYEAPVITPDGVPVKMSEVTHKAWGVESRHDLNNEQIETLELVIPAIEAGEIPPELDAIVAEMIA